MTTEDCFYYDTIIVGAGPAGLSCAIRLKQLQPNHSICILEKSSTVGAHILSGAILDPKALNELIPNWKNQSPPVNTLVKQDNFLYLTPKKSFRLPIPPSLRNQGSYLIRLSVFCQWLARIAEQLGVEIYTGFAASELIFNASNQAVCGIKTGPQGLDKNYQPTSRYQPGMALHANHILLAEGCRGSLSREVITRFNLDKNKDPQKYGLGVKEIWEIDPQQHDLGKITHTIGYPLDNQTYGGGFLYHIDCCQISIGFVTGLDYQNAFLDPFEELQKFKLHPDIKNIFTSARRIGYGAKTLVEGGIQSLPMLNFPHGLLIGDAAGFLNNARLKGIHTAMKSGIVAAETVFQGTLSCYEKNIKNSWLGEELYTARNIRPAFQWGLWKGLLLSGLESYVFRGKLPFTLHHKKADYLYTNTNTINNTPVLYPKPDQRVTFDKSGSLLLSNINYYHNQPNHLILKNTAFKQKSYAYCPAQVYEIHQEKLYIHAQNCLHCKACDIKDPDQNITWTPPEGGSGPDFSGM